MAIPKKRILVVTASVWLAASGSAAALTYELNRPLFADVPARISPAPESPAPLLPGDSEVPGAATVYLAPVQVVGHAPQRPATARLGASVGHRDIRAMRCADWRDLDMGSGHVQVCD